jgi:hypothetical protein
LGSVPFHALDANSYANVAARVVPSALASLSAATLEGIVYVASIRMPYKPPPGSARRSAISFLFLGSYDSETHTTNAKTDRNIRATTPKKIPKTTASTLRFGLNVEPKESLASSGRSGS